MAELVAIAIAVVTNLLTAAGGIATFVAKKHEIDEEKEKKKKSEKEES